MSLIKASMEDVIDRSEQAARFLSFLVFSSSVSPCLSDRRHTCMRVQVTVIQYSQIVFSDKYHCDCSIYMSIDGVHERERDANCSNT